MNHLPYSDNSNIYYPIPPAEHTTENLGEYGLTAKRFLQKYRPALYDEWRKAGSLSGYLLQLDARYQTLRVKTIQRLEQSEDALESTRFLATSQRGYAIQAQAEEFVAALLTQELEELKK